MFRPRLTTCLLLATVALGATACEQFTTRQAPPAGSLTRNLMMIDKDGKNYGTVELDPINGGKVYDSQGRLIGRVVSIGPEPIAPTAQYPVTQ